MNYDRNVKTGKPVVAVGAPGSLMRKLATSELETVFSEGHELHNRIYYDNREGSYYDRYSDIFITLDEARAFGIPC